MEATRPAALSGPTADVARLAKAALRRLAADKLEPTPENYARAWRQESGEPAPPLAPPAADDGPAIAALIERIVRGIERGSRGWTTARKKESLQRVLTGSRSDARRLQQRLSQLVASWDVEPSDAPGATSAPGAPTEPAAEPASQPGALDMAPTGHWGRAVQSLGGTVQLALPPGEESPHELALALGTVLERVEHDGADAPLVAELEALCARAGPVLQHRHHLVDLLNGLCGELTASLTDLAENDSWARGQCEAMQVRIDEGLSARGVRAVSELLRDTRSRQAELREERERSRDALKGLINRMLSELDELGEQTGNFHDSVGRYADVIEKADTLEGLTGVVREMVEESRTVQALVRGTQARLQEEHGKAQGLTQRVMELESEMQRLSNEVATDQLTQVANRRGLLQAFDAESARLARGGGALSIGLLDIDNFKRLNDELGHGAGDEALKSLAAVVSKTLRPTDHVARYGGEEFVVLLPDTPVEEGQQILTRLQRALTGGLFMHEQRQVFVTFSAGLTGYIAGERIEQALERADRGLYEAKRTGKNRTCIG
ncbi:MAG: GGDEF domain-containing protein [Pseudomonadota bacterium]|nr:GGDEF domain-containing protein [Pseudomonadota bacterium]